jgi:AraC-like DNA-binding protein
VGGGGRRRYLAGMAAGRDRTTEEARRGEEIPPGVPILAARAGHYREWAPSAALRPHFRCAWSHAVPAGPQLPIAVVPDGCVDLLWQDGGLTVAGPDVTAATPALRPGSTILGLRFRPGAAARWLGLPMTEIVGSAVDLDQLWGPRARALEARLQDMATLTAQAKALDRLLAALAPTIDAPDREASAIFAGLWGEARAAGPRLAALPGRLDLSERTLRRRSREHFGYGPKTLERILRFQRFLALAGQTPGSGLAGLAAEAGYADQAHLTREVRTLCGMTAATLLAQLAA